MEGMARSAHIRTSSKVAVGVSAKAAARTRLSPQPFIVRLPNPGQRSLRLPLGFMQGKLRPQFLDRARGRLQRNPAHPPSGPSAFQFGWPFDRQVCLPDKSRCFQGLAVRQMRLWHSAMVANRPKVNFSAGIPSVGAAIWYRWEAKGWPVPDGWRGIKGYLKSINGCLPCSWNAFAGTRIVPPRSLPLLANQARGTLYAGAR
jgi:hypothetical protein